MKNLLCGLLWVVVPTVVSAQTNPCTDPPPPGIVINAAAMYVQLPKFTTLLPNGEQEVTSFVVGYFSMGVDPVTGIPLTTIPYPKSAYTLVAGTPDCYKALIVSAPVGQNLFSETKQIRTGGVAPGEGPWSGPSNPFSLVGVPPQPAPAILR